MSRIYSSCVLPCFHNNEQSVYIEETTNAILEAQSNEDTLLIKRITEYLLSDFVSVHVCSECMQYIESLPSINLHIFCTISFSGSLQLCHLSFNLARNPIILKKRNDNTALSVMPRKTQVDVQWIAMHDLLIMIIM